MVIAIDGPGGVGKSTVSRAVARQLGIAYLDTGATYRAATLIALRCGVRLNDSNALVEEISRHAIGYREGSILLDGVPVDSAIRSDEVTRAVSEVSAHARVREHVVGIQRAWVDDNGGDAVVEGRDIGTVVFPDAEVKVFLTARPEVRAHRRALDAETEGAAVDEVAAALAARDTADSTREASPMRQARDATGIDTSDHTIAEVVAMIVALVAEPGTPDSPDDGPSDAQEA
ncbi:MAG TPA: (d)CMP kinase [Acidimicrobiia bacterium]|nr:(d)CMP kinase [Acidimicrobiia bacterium]